MALGHVVHARRERLIDDDAGDRPRRSPRHGAEPSGHHAHGPLIETSLGAHPLRQGVPSDLCLRQPECDEAPLASAFAAVHAVGLLEPQLREPARWTDGRVDTPSCDAIDGRVPKGSVRRATCRLAGDGHPEVPRERSSWSRTIWFAISRNLPSVPAGIVAPAAAWWPPPYPPTALLAACMTAARSRPRATSSRVVRAETLIPSSALANAIIGRSFDAPSRFKAMLAAMPTTVSRIWSAAWKYCIASI